MTDISPLQWGQDLLTEIREKIEAGETYAQILSFWIERDLTPLLFDSDKQAEYLRLVASSRNSSERDRAVTISAQFDEASREIWRTLFGRRLSHDQVDDLVRMFAITANGALCEVLTGASSSHVIALVTVERIGMAQRAAGFLLSEERPINWV